MVLTGQRGAEAQGRCMMTQEFAAVRATFDSWARTSKAYEAFQKSI